MIGSYRVFTDTEVHQSEADAKFAKKKARTVHFEDETQYLDKLA